MRAHFFQHDPVDGPGCIESWLEHQGYEITWTHFFASAQMPDLNELDFLIILGGPMSANDEEAFPWLLREKAFIRQAVLSGIPILGICLGAQLIASALGAKVYKSPVKEIGWFSLIGLPKEDEKLFSFPVSFHAFQWHEETFDLPQGAHLLVTSPTCKNQAFQWGRKVMGLQFHLEVRPQDVKAMTDYCLPELVPNKYIQSQRDILSFPAENYALANRLMTQILSFLTWEMRQSKSSPGIRAGP